MFMLHLFFLCLFFVAKILFNLIKKGVNNMSEIYKNDIIKDSKYLIHKFNVGEKPVTNMQIQKLMYFFEAYYTLKKNLDSLYDCHFNAWAFGPVSIPLYKEYRKFGGNQIELTEQDIEDGNNISSDKKEVLNEIYEAFKNAPATRLVDLTHMEDSPWTEVWEKNGNKVGSGENTYIDKIKTKEWFKKHFVKED